MNPIEVLTEQEKQEREAIQRAVRNLHSRGHQDAWKQVKERQKARHERVLGQLPIEVVRHETTEIVVKPSERYLNAIVVVQKRWKPIVWRFRRSITHKIEITIDAIGDFVVEAELVRDTLAHAQVEQPHTPVSAERQMRNTNYDGHLQLTGTIGGYVFTQHDCSRHPSVEMKLTDWEFTQLLTVLKSLEVPLLWMKEF